MCYIIQQKLKWINILNKLKDINLFLDVLCGKRKLVTFKNEKLTKIEGILNNIRNQSLYLEWKRWRIQKLYGSWW